MICIQFHTEDPEIICPPWCNSPPVGQGLLIIEALRSHSDTPHSVRHHWTSDQLDAETSTRQHTTLKRDTDIHAFSGIRTHNSRKPVAVDSPLTLRGHRDRHPEILCATIQKWIDRAIWRPWLVHRWRDANWTFPRHCVNQMVVVLLRLSFILFILYCWSVDGPLRSKRVAKLKV
jgi:hypothetical protein